MEVRKRGRIIGLKDYIAFNYFHNLRQIVLFAVLEIAVFPLVILLFYSPDMEMSPAAMYFGALILFTAITGVFFLLQLLMLRIRSKKQYDSSKVMQAESELVANEAGVFETSEYGSTGFQWRDIHKAAEGKHAMYIYFSRIQAFIFPKRLLSAEDRDTLRILVSKNLNPKKNHLKKRRV